MRQRLKGFVCRHSSIFNPMRPIVYPVIRRGGGEIVSSYVENLAAFSEIYADNLWESPESRSGWGSTLAHTVSLRRDLAELLANMNVNTFFDAPSTTSNWMSYVSLPEGTHYIGADIVPDLITALSAKYGDRVGHDFRVIDIAHDALPSADLWLCRDVLGHLRNADSLPTLRNFVASDITYLLTKTYHFVAVNSDTRPGGFRYINLRRPPFGLGSRGSVSGISSHRIRPDTSVMVARERQNGLAMMFTNVCPNDRRTRQARIERRKSVPDRQFWCAPSVLVISVRFV